MITGPSSFLPTTLQFSTHWTAANTTLGSGGPVLLEDGTDVAQFEAEREVLLTLRGDVEDADLEAEEARVDLAEAKALALAQLNLFNLAVRGRMGSSKYARLLADVPGIGDGREIFTKPMNKAVKLWTKINATPPVGFSPPLVLADDTTLTVFSATVGALPGIYDTVTTTGEDFSLALDLRNDQQDVLYAMMKAYRVAVPARFLAGSATLDSLPALSDDSTRTPDPVELSGGWDAALTAARLTATESSDPDVKEYELRWCAGANYSQATEHVAGSIPAGTPPVFVTTKGLPASGSVASFRVYVRLTSGGEAGSETLVVTRP